jgi:hypothetical protein
LSDVKVKSENVTQPLHQKMRITLQTCQQIPNEASKHEIQPTDNGINHLEKSIKKAPTTAKTTLQSTIREKIGSTHNYFNENEKNNEVFTSRNVLKTEIDTQELTQQNEQTNPLNLHHSESNPSYKKGEKNAIDVPDRYR